MISEIKPKRVFISTIVMVLISITTFAKRAPPDPVAPIENKGIVFKVVPWAIANGTDQNGGFIQAIDKETNLVIWELQVYKTKYSAGLERDVQDVFITGLRFNSDKNVLLIQNEMGFLYKVSIKDRRVIGVKLNK